MLDRPIEIVQGDDQNKPDVAASLAREWVDSQGVDVLMDGAASSSGLAIQQIAREKKHIYLITGPATSDMTGKQCSPYGIHFAYDTYALAHGTGAALTKAGGDTWFFVTADYAFGYALERDTIAAVRPPAGSSRQRSARHWARRISPATWCRRRRRAPRSIGFANAGTDLQNCIKQAAEFGLSQSGVRMATLLMAINDVNSLGLKACQGLVYTDSFYWDMTDKTRAWAKRWAPRCRRHDAGPAARGELLRREPLAEGGEGGGDHRRRCRRG